jgi:hypothetical protein
MIKLFRTLDHLFFELVFRAFSSRWSEIRIDHLRFVTDFDGYHRNLLRYPVVRNNGRPGHAELCCGIIRMQRRKKLSTILYFVEPIRVAFKIVQRIFATDRVSLNISRESSKLANWPTLKWSPFLRHKFKLGQLVFLVLPKPKSATNLN